jgi:hypothetical protein
MLCVSIHYQVVAYSHGTKNRWVHIRILEPTGVYTHVCRYTCMPALSSGCCPSSAGWRGLGTRLRRVVLTWLLCCSCRGHPLHNTRRASMTWQGYLLIKACSVLVKLHCCRMTLAHYPCTHLDLYSVM